MTDANAKKNIPIQRYLEHAVFLGPNRLKFVLNTKVHSSKNIKDQWDQLTLKQWERYEGKKSEKTYIQR